MSKRIFLAGATGAIGQPLCRLLVSDGYIVFGTTRYVGKSDELKALGIIPVVVDVYDAERLKDIVVEIAPEVVMHQLTDLPYALEASKMPEARLKNARLREEGTHNLVLAAVAARAKKFIAQSIAFAYAPGTPPFDESHPLNVDSSDEMSAMSARAVASLEHQVLNGSFEGVVLRYGKLYGAETGFDHALANDSVHVDAAADAARKSISTGIKGVFNIAEAGGTVATSKARAVLGWSAQFRMT